MSLLARRLMVGSADGGGGGGGSLPSTGLWAHYNAEDIAGLSDGDPIATWADSSGNGRNATQSNASARPIYKTAIVNGLPVVRFGNLEYFSLPSPAALSEGEIFVVLKNDNDPPTSGQGGIWRVGTSGSADHYPWTDGNIYMGWGSNGRKNVGNPTLSMATWHILNISSEAGSWVLRQNGAVFYSTGSNTPAFVNPAYLGRSSVTSYLYDGDMAEIAWYDQVLSSDDRDDAHTYLADRYGITL